MVTSSPIKPRSIVTIDGTLDWNMPVSQIIA